jgi:hypothetical protein
VSPISGTKPLIYPAAEYDAFQLPRPDNADIDQDLLN